VLGRVLGRVLGKDASLGNSVLSSWNRSAGSSIPQIVRDCRRVMGG